MQNSWFLLPQFWPFLLHSFLELCQDLQVVHLLKDLTILIMPAISWMLKYLSYRTIPLIFSTSSLTFDLEGHPACSTIFTFSYFWSWRASILHVQQFSLPSDLPWIICAINLHVWHNIITAHFFQQLETFCRRFFQFCRKFQIEALLNFHLSDNLAEQHNTVTIKQNTEANQLLQRDEARLVRFM
jgi:hypothetical protein